MRVKRETRPELKRYRWLMKQRRERLTEAYRRLSRMLKRTGGELIELA